MNAPFKILRRASIGWAAVPLLLPLLGCSMWDHDREPKPFSSDSAGAANSPETELPARQAAQLCLTTARQMQEKGRVEQAIYLYEKARRDDPTLASVAHPLAFLYDQQGDGVRALAEYQKALAASPKDPDLLNDFGYYYYRRGNLDEAKKWYRQAIALAPDHKQARTNLAMVLGNQGQFQESYNLFAAVVGPAAAHSNVGVLMAKQGHYDQARESFQKALSLDSTLTQPKAFLAYLDRQGVPPNNDKL
jgi:Tfp pilus assembly protein PilF